MWLSLIKGLGIKKYLALINVFKSNKGIFNATKLELSKISQINSNLIDNLLCLETKKNVKNHLRYMELNNIDIICINDPSYPQDLKQIYDPPICLYIRGNKNIFNNLNISLVGCRNCTSYGKQIAEQLGYDLGSHNVNVVSGLARGIDSFSHLGAINGNGLTTAVLGSGIDIIYPKENIYLAKKILESNGTIISEYPLGSPPDKLHFPARNRIISGISKGVVVIESKLKSGSLITAGFALEQNREVFAVPRKY